MCKGQFVLGFSKEMEQKFRKELGERWGFFSFKKHLLKTLTVFRPALGPHCGTVLFHGSVASPKGHQNSLFSPSLPRHSQDIPKFSISCCRFLSSSKVTLMAKVCCGPLSAKADTNSPKLLVAEVGAQGCNHEVGLLPSGCCHGRAVDQKQNPKEGGEGSG